MGIRYGDRTRVSGRVSEWLNGPDASKVVAVDVFDGTYPNMTLTGGAYLGGTTGLVTSGNVVGQGASTPHDAFLAITGDLDIQIRCSISSLSTFQIFVTKDNVTSQRCWSFLNVNTNLPRFRWSTDGTSGGYITVTGSDALFASANETKWIRVTLDVDNGAGGYEVKFFEAADSATVPTSWTQVGTTITGGSTTSIFAGTDIVAFGYGNAVNAGSAATFARTRILDGIGGTAAIDADFTVPAYGTRSFTESSSNAATVTLTGAATSWTANWSPPAGATFVKVLCVGGGGGAGSGRKGASLAARSGGGGGGSGGVSFAEFSASAFTSSVTVMVGTGGTGGASQTNNSTNGLNGTPGVVTTFGAFCGAGGGSVGGGGSTTNASGGSGGVGLVSGGTASLGQSVQNAPQGARTLFVGAGSGGGGMNVSDTIFLGGLGVAGLVTGSFNFSSGSGGDGRLTGSPAHGTNGQFGCGGGGGGAGTDSVVDSGAGGNGGTGFCVVVSYRDVDIQEFTASGTWNKPVGDYSIAKIFVVGAGGGGGSGATAASGVNALGSTGGGGGAITCITIPFSQLGTSETVTVGLGGTGGAARTGNSEGINPGTNGGESSVGTIASARGGTAGVNDLLGASLGGVGFSFTGGGGGQGGSSGNATGVNSYTGGGGGGGFLSSNNFTVGTAGNGGVGAVYTSAITAAAGGTIATPNGANGADASTVAGFYGGLGGGGGRGNFTANGGNGGNGSIKGGGGGGGSGARNGYTSGAGGNGGDGYVCVICI